MKCLTLIVVFTLYSDYVSSKGFLWFQLSHHHKADVFLVYLVFVCLPVLAQKLILIIIACNAYVQSQLYIVFKRVHFNDPAKYLCRLKMYLLGKKANVCNQEFLF